MINVEIIGLQNKRILKFDNREIFYEFHGDFVPNKICNSDFALISVIFYAMLRNRPLYIEGEVSSLLLENMEEFQRAWRILRPDLFSIVDVKASNEIADSQIKRSNAAVIAYSGGVDATSSLVWQLTKSGRRKREIKAAVLAHGLDVPLKTTMNSAIKNAEKTLNSFNIPLTVVKTNWTEHIGHWEMTFVTAITSILHQFDTGYGIISSDEDYSSLALPWSSNPATNYLLSGCLALQTEGTGFTRSEKVKIISQYPQVTESLRVCWEKYTEDSINCGHCEKCLRTKMNFAANGLQSPACLGEQISPSDARRRLARNDVQLLYLEEILRTARINGIKLPWVNALEIGIKKTKAVNSIKRIFRALKQHVNI
jgi:7-cyano-7-deazaguanine synthase in queuosine biosynthesis